MPEHCPICGKKNDGICIQCFSLPENIRVGIVMLRYGFRNYIRVMASTGQKPRALDAVKKLNAQGFFCPGCDIIECDMSCAIPKMEPNIADGKQSTSRNAAKTFHKKLVGFTENLERKIIESGKKGMTCFEVECEMGAKHQTASSALNRLRNARRIYDSGNRRKTNAGIPAIVYIHAEVYSLLIKKTS